MKEPFIPLVPANAALPRITAAATPPPLALLPPPEAAPAPTASLPPPVPVPLSPRPEPVPCAEPNITLQRDGDRVIGIQVKCTCGQVVEVACSY